MPTEATALDLVLGADLRLMSIVALSIAVSLFNQYGVNLLNPDKHKHVKKEAGQAFIDWLTSADGQKAINDDKINGQQLFFANASVPGA